MPALYLNSPLNGGNTINMKQLLIIILCLWSIAYGQSVGQLRYDTTKILKVGGYNELKIQNSTMGVTGGVLTNVDGNGWGKWVLPSATPIPISSLLAATGTNIIDNTTFGQTWNWTNHTGFIGAALQINSVTTAAVNNANTFGITASGANATAVRTTNTARFVNSHTGTTSTNNALLLEASGGTTNNALYVNTGNVNLQPLTASQFLTLDASKNMTSTAVASSILAASLSDEVGTDKVVFNTSPTFVTSVIGGASFDVFNTTSTTINAFGASTATTIGATTGTATIRNPNITFPTTSGIITIGGGAVASELRFKEPSGSGTDHTSIKAGIQSANISYTLPIASPAGDGYMLLSTAAGQWQWADPATNLAALFWPLSGTGDLTAPVLIRTQGSTLTFDNNGADIIKYGDVDDDAGGIVQTISAATSYFDNSAHTSLIGINTSTPAVALDVVGDIQATGTITPSDRRYKKNIQPLDNALGLIMSLKPSTYNYNQLLFPDKKFPTGKQYGLIAQEVEKNIPELVKTLNDGYKSLNYTELVPIMVRALQQQQAEIELLQKQIKQLKK